MSKLLIQVLQVSNDVPKIGFVILESVLGLSCQFQCPQTQQSLSPWCQYRLIMSGSLSVQGCAKNWFCDSSVSIRLIMTVSVPKNTAKSNYCLTLFAYFPTFSNYCSILYFTVPHGFPWTAHGLLIVLMESMSNP